MANLFISRGLGALVLLAAGLIAPVQPLVLRDHVNASAPLQKSSESCSKLFNQGTHYTVEVGLGTPPQKLDLIADTGSNALVALSCACRENGMCEENEECFTGEGKSSTYAAQQNAPLVMISYGVGNVVASPATDVVRVGRVSTTMEKGLLLMVRRTFLTSYRFEGILGLGVPPWAETAMDNSSDPSYKEKLKPGSRVRFPGFLEIAQVNLFSMCFRPGEGGALRLNPAETPKLLKQIGQQHWSLALVGFSAGSSSAPISVCSATSKTAGTESPCAAIPDSGTTHIMGPKEDVDRILADVCDQWPRCQKFKSKEKVTSAEATRHVLWDCHTWMTPESGISEVPSLFVHLQSSAGEAEVLEITAMSYVFSSTSVVGDPVCQPSFDAWPAKIPGLTQSKKHGPAWILGTPLFYEYQVAYGLRPPAIGFSKAPCTLCGGETTSLFSDRGLGHKRHAPRVMNGKPRLPSFDVNDEL